MSWLLNVRLEMREERHPEGHVTTQTDLFDIEIDENEQIKTIIPAAERARSVSGQDMEGWLMLPAFKEMHNHLDKTYLSVGWKACRPVNNLRERLDFEAEELVELAETAEQRATAMIERHLSYGVNHIRTHVNIDPFIGLKNLEGVKKALAKFEGQLTSEIVAFPQHGLLEHEDMPTLLKEALNSGATHLGALDPGGIDGHIEESLRLTMALAKEHGVDVDLHLHDRGDLGYYTMSRWLELIDEEEYQGRTAFSHAFGLSHLTPHVQKTFAKKMASRDVSVMSTIPIDVGNKLIPIEILEENGVQVSFGCDGYFDSWSPYVSGDVLEKVRNYCQYRSLTDEKSLRLALGHITNGVTPLTETGEYQWPKVGMEASGVFLPASCSAEVVARVPEKRLLLSRGKFVQDDFER